jgi:pilus assembly protein CpaC
VEIAEGESLIIGGLISKSSMRSGDSVPLLGEIPVIGALFRSKAFQKNESELIVVISPKLVASTKEAPALPTDTDDTPSRSDFFLLDKP